jgi:ADP-ribose pyrophosphatase
MLPEIQIINENVVYENDYGKLYDDDVVFLPQNKTGKYVRWKWHTPYSVGILPVMQNGEVVLLESFRHAARKTVIEIPKGFGNNKKQPLYIAQNELREEMGLISERIEYLGELTTDAAFTYNPMKLFIAWQCAEIRSQHEDSEVIIGKHAYPLVEIPKLIAGFKISDAISIIALMIAYQKGYE